MNSIFPVICCEAIEESTAFYADLLDLEVTFESGWYTLLRAPEQPRSSSGSCFGSIPRFPKPFAARPKGSSSRSRCPTSTSYMPGPGPPAGRLCKSSAMRSSASATSWWPIPTARLWMWS